MSSSDQHSKILKKARQALKKTGSVILNRSNSFSSIDIDKRLLALEQRVDKLEKRSASCSDLSIVSATSSSVRAETSSSNAIFEPRASDDVQVVYDSIRDWIVKQKEPGLNMFQRATISNDTRQAIFERFKHGESKYSSKLVTFNNTDPLANALSQLIDSLFFLFQFKLEKERNNARLGPTLVHDLNSRLKIFKEISKAIDKILSSSEQFIVNV